MGWKEIVLIVACVAVVAAVAITSYIRKKQGKCSGDCGWDCSHCSRCSYANKGKKKK